VSRIRQTAHCVHKHRMNLLFVQCNTLHGTEYKITCGVCVCVCVLLSAHGFWGPNISKTVRDRGSVTMGQWHNGGSIGHVTDDVTCPR